MALLWADTCGDHYATADLDRVWDSIGTASVVAGGRCSSNCIKCNPGGVLKGVNSTGTTVIFGVAVKPINDGQSQSDNYNGMTRLCTLYRGGTDFLGIMMTASGALWGLRNPSLPFADTREAFLTYGGIVQWNIYQFYEVKMDLAAGTMTVQVNGQEVWSDTGLTLTTSPTDWTGISFGSSFNSTTYIDDVYIADGSGAENNDFLGDVRVEALEPTADGAVQDWTLGAGSSHWSAVDDGATPDDDTSYIESNTAGDTETNIHEDSALPTTGQIFGVQVNILAKKDQPGNRLLAAVTRQGGSNYVGDDLGVNQDEYTYIYDIFQTNPATSAQWTVTEVNDSEWGVKVTN